MTGDIFIPRDFGSYKFGDFNQNLTFCVGLKINIMDDRIASFHTTILLIVVQYYLSYAKVGDFPRNFNEMLF